MSHMKTQFGHEWPQVTAATNNPTNTTDAMSKKVTRVLAMIAASKLGFPSASSSGTSGAKRSKP